MNVQPSQDPFVEKIIIISAEICGEDHRGVLAGFPDLRSRHYAYHVLRRARPHLRRSDAARLVCARDIYAQARVAHAYAKRGGRTFDQLVDAILFRAAGHSDIVPASLRLSEYVLSRDKLRPAPRRRVTAPRSAVPDDIRVHYKPSPQPEFRDAVSITARAMGDPDASRAAARVCAASPEPSIADLCRGISAQRPSRIEVARSGSLTTSDDCFARLVKTGG